jgi:hypothetical protein
MRTIREIKQHEMLEIFVTSIAEKLIFELKSPYVNKKPDQKVVPVFIFMSRKAKVHYWNMFQEYPENWRLRNG